MKQLQNTVKEAKVTTDPITCSHFGTGPSRNLVYVNRKLGEQYNTWETCVMSFPDLSPVESLLGG